MPSFDRLKALRGHKDMPTVLPKGVPVPTSKAKPAKAAPAVSLGDPATVWKSLDRFNNPAPGDWANTEVLLYRLKHQVRFNAWTERSEIREAGGEWVARQDWHLDKLARIGSSDPHNYRPAESTFRRAIDSIARDNTVDPARDLLLRRQSEWDGELRLHSWLSHACGVPYDAYHQAVGQCILLGLVARIRRPGVKFDLMPVLVSELQGTSKSTLARMLALDDDYFTESVHLGDAEKELVLSLAGKSVAEISEMRTRGEVDATKAMISATHDEGRPAYGRSIVKRPRRNIFVGTTNRPEFLEDPSGARRFLPIVVQGEINLEFVREHLPQLIGKRRQCSPVASISTCRASFGQPRASIRRLPRRSPTPKSCCGSGSLVMHHAGYLRGTWCCCCG